MSMTRSAPSIVLCVVLSSMVHPGTARSDALYQTLGNSRIVVVSPAAHHIGRWDDFDFADGRLAGVDFEFYSKINIDEPNPMPLDALANHLALSAGLQMWYTHGSASSLLSETFPLYAAADHQIRLTQLEYQFPGQVLGYQFAESDNPNGSAVS